MPAVNLSSGTKQRWEIPQRCPYCNEPDTVTINGILTSPDQARLKCTECRRLWTINPTPIHEVADTSLKKVAILAGALERIKGMSAVAGYDAGDGAIYNLAAAALEEAAKL